MGVTLPFEQTVKDVCASCNHGWMSRLESVAARVLPPLILGHSADIDRDDLGPLAAWAQKTALVGMLVSSTDERARGYGLPASEYREMYAIRDQLVPLQASTFWIGRHVGTSIAFAQVTPLVVAIDDLQKTATPQAYVLTLVIGHLAIHAVRFTSPGFELPVSLGSGLNRLWPSNERVAWASASPLDDDAVAKLAAGKDLVVHEQHVALRPWRKATELNESRLVRSMVELPAICGKHFLYYPDVLAREAQRGTFHAFATACECGVGYLVQTEADGAHCKAAGEPDAVEAKYDAIPGEEMALLDDDGVFVYKRLSSTR